MSKPFDSNPSATLPAWAAAASLAQLPVGLTWSGTGEVPAIGARVHVYMNGFGAAKVEAYFHADGYLGIICAPESLPEWFKKQSPGVTTGHFFGRELEPYGTRKRPT